MQILITRRPLGEATEWVRDAWIGHYLPLAKKRRLTRRGVGVLTGPKSFLGELWALVSGRTEAIDGYRFSAGAAVDLLAKQDPRAAQWWHDNAAAFIGHSRYFIFDAECCRPIDE